VSKPRKTLGDINHRARQRATARRPYFIADAASPAAVDNLRRQGEPRPEASSRRRRRRRFLTERSSAATARSAALHG